jgi:hypothetical protein
MIKDRKSNLVSLFIFIFSFVITLAFLLKKFYLFGINEDAPIIANLMWHNGWNIFFNDWQGGGSYYQTHSSLIFILISQLSYILPLNMIEYASVIIALSVGLLGYITAQILYKFKKSLKLNNLLFLALTILLSIGFVFNVYNKDCIALAHFEIFYISFLVAFLYYFFIHKYYLSYFFLFLFLITREDFGFHLFTLISIILFFNYFVLKFENLQTRKLIVICLISLLASIALCYMKKFFPGDDAFSRVYFSTKWPEILEAFRFAHLVKTFLIFSKNNIFTIINLVLSIFFAIRYRSYFILIPIVSILPWLYLHLLSNDRTAGMPDYYKFPFAIILIWPALTCLIFEKNITNTLRKKIYFFQIILIAFSFSYTIPFYKKIFPLVAISNIENSNLFTEEVRKFADHSNLKNMRVTLDILTLNTRLYKKDNVVLANGTLAENNFDKDKIIFYNVNDSFIYESITKYDYKNAFQIKDTPIRIITNDNLKKYFTNLATNNHFWLESLSLPKNYMYREHNDSLEVKSFNINSIVKKPIYLRQKKYCIAIKQKQSIQLLFSVYRTHDESEIFKFLVQDKYNNLCFDIEKTNSYKKKINHY